MPSRPRRALRPPLVLRVGRIAAPALLVGLGTAGILAAAAGADSPQTVAAPAVVAPAAAPISTPTSAPVREQVTSRGATDLRPVLSSSSSEPLGRLPKATFVEPALTVVGHRYTRVDLNVRAEDDPDSSLLTVLETGAKVSVTASVHGAWRFVSYRGHGAWVKDRYLVRSKPKAEPKTGAAGISSAACAGGAKVESGLTRDAVRVHRAICARYPAVKAYGGVRADSLPEHPSGRALDAMISDTTVGWQIATWVRANAKRLGVSEVLYDRHIWTVQRSGEGWRTFADRGSATANHEDHVHVTVYGNAGTS